MLRIGKTTVLLLVTALVALWVAFGGVAGASSVDPILVDGNPSCTNLNADNTTFPSITSDFGFKLNGSPNGTFTLTSTNGELTGGAPEDSTNSVTISNSDGVYFDWSATLGIDAVIVKGGDDANAYVYTPEAFSDTGLHSPINPNTGEPYGISHIEFCYDYELTAEKTANAEFTRTYTWNITKSVNPDSHTGFFGDEFTSSYDVFVDRTVTDSDFKVTGEITINNPTPFNVPFSVSDSVNGTPASVDCGGGSASGTLAAGASITCDYVAELGDTLPPDGTNTATITSDNPDVDGATATAPYAFGEPTTVVGHETINVTDYFDGDTVGEVLGSASGDFTFEYDRNFQCPTDESLYEDGVYTDSFPNYAEIDETGQQDDAKVDLTCYAPVITKDVTPAWEEFYDWDIFKNVDNTEFVGFLGDEWVFNYDIDVDLTEFDELNFSASGTINVTNPHPTAPMTVGLTDAVNGFNGDIIADADCDFDGTDLTIPADSTATCEYKVNMGDDLDGQQTTEYTNTATATFGGGSFSFNATFTFGDVEPTLATGSEPAEVTATDDNATPGDTGDDHHSTTITETTEDVITYQQSDICPTDTSLYTNGVYELTLTNIAVIDQTEDSDTETVTINCYIPAEAQVVKTTTEGGEDIGQFPFTFNLYDPSGTLVESRTLGTGGGTVTFATELEDEGTWTVEEVLPDGWVSTTATNCTFEVAFPGSADQTYSCTFDNVEKSRVDLLKLTNGLETTTQTWNFAIYEGPDGFGGTEVASDSTPPALLDFGDTDLNPLATYTLCELEVPAGYSTFWQIDTDGDGVGDTTVVPYNPNADDDPPEDVGNRCVDFGADTGIPLVPGTTLHFVVDNQQPGGAPRTPGYWKNWNRCTGGNQQFTADANGGWQEGFWLLEDVLDPTIGGGIVWDDILDDDFVFPIETCEVAVDILDKREVDDPDIVGDGKKAASDPLHNLATHLLAAQLNFGAGACTTQDVLDAALQAETLLDEYNFDGDGHDPLKKKDPDADLANQLASFLDDYNNGEFCGDFAD